MDPTVEELDPEMIEMIIAGGKQFQMYQEQTYVFSAFKPSSLRSLAF